MGIFDFLKRKPKQNVEKDGIDILKSNNPPRITPPTKTKPAAMPKPGQNRHSSATVVPPASRSTGISQRLSPSESAEARRRRSWERDEDDLNYGYTSAYAVDNVVSPLGDADFDGVPNIVDSTPYTGSDNSYCAPQTESSSSWTSDSSSSGCYDSGSSSSYDSGSGSSYDSGSSSSYDSGSSSYDSGSSW